LLAYHTVFPNGETERGTEGVTEISPWTLPAFLFFPLFFPLGLPPFLRRIERFGAVDVNDVYHTFVDPPAPPEPRIPSLFPVAPECCYSPHVGERENSSGEESYNVRGSSKIPS